MLYNQVQDVNSHNGPRWHQACVHSGDVQQNLAPSGGEYENKDVDGEQLGLLPETYNPSQLMIPLRAKDDSKALKTMAAAGAD